MPDPIGQAVSDALDSVNPIVNTTDAAADAAADTGADAGAADAGTDAGADAAAGAAGADAGTDGDQGDAGADDAAAGDGADEGDAGGEQLDLATVTTKEVTELDDAEKAFIVENQDDLTVKQLKDYQAAGIDFDGTADADDKAVETAPIEEPAPKLHEVPENDDDLVVTAIDAEGNEHKFAGIEDMPEDFQFRDSRQVVQIAAQLQELASKRTERANQRAENESMTQSVETKNRVVSMWNTELAELQKEGIIPAGTADFLNGKFANKKVQESVEGLFNYMTDLNSKRQAQGLPLLSSLRDVQHFRAADQAAQAASAAAVKDKAVKTKKAETVAASKGSTAANAAKDEPSYVRGSGQSIQDITEAAINDVSK